MPPGQKSGPGRAQHNPVKVVKPKPVKAKPAKATPAKVDPEMIGSYSLKGVFSQKPEDVKTVILLIVTAVLAVTHIKADAYIIALCGTALERFIGLFYVQRAVAKETHRKMQALRAAGMKG